MKKNPPIADELIEVLKRSFLPTLIVEGSDDIFIYRWLSEKLEDQMITLMPCTGRTTLFSIYDRRNEFPNAKVAFIADQDTYKFTGIPKDKSEIIFTSGYSIENDIYAGSAIEQIIDKKDKKLFENLLETICTWFAFELNKTIANTPSPRGISTHINLIAPPPNYQLCSNFKSEINFSPPPQELVDSIINSHNLSLRGKQLFQILSRLMSGRDRLASFSDKHLMEIAFKKDNNPHLDLITKKISDSLSI